MGMINMDRLRIIAFG